MINPRIKNDHFGATVYTYTSKNGVRVVLPVKDSSLYAVQSSLSSSSVLKFCKTLSEAKRVANQYLKYCQRGEVLRVLHRGKEVFILGRT